MKNKCIKLTPEIKEALEKSGINYDEFDVEEFTDRAFMNTALEFSHQFDMFSFSIGTNLNTFSRILKIKISELVG